MVRKGDHTYFRLQCAGTIVVTQPAIAWRMAKLIADPAKIFRDHQGGKTCPELRRGTTRSVFSEVTAQLAILYPVSDRVKRPVPREAAVSTCDDQVHFRCDQALVHRGFSNNYDIKWCKSRFWFKSGSHRWAILGRGFA